MAKVTISVYGRDMVVDFDACVNLMDDELREQAHRELAPCSEQEFIDRYCQLHTQKYGEDFQV